MAQGLKDIADRTVGSLFQLAMRAGISPPAVYRIASGLSDPKASTVRRFAEVTGVSAGEIVEAIKNDSERSATA